MRELVHRIPATLSIIGILFGAACTSGTAPSPTAAPTKSSSVSTPATKPPEKSAAPAKATEPTAAKSAGTTEVKPVAGGDWKAEWDKLVEAAKKEGKVVVRAVPGDIYRAVTGEFQKAYPGIQVEFNGLAGKDFLPKIQAERNADQYLLDVSVGSTGTAYEMRNGGFLEPIKQWLVLPEVLDDSKWLGGFDAGLFDNDKKYVYCFVADLSNPVHVNRDVVLKSELSRVEDLVDPKWKGKMATEEPRTTGTSSVAFGHLLMTLGEDFLRKLFNQDLAVTRDKRQMLEWVVRGNIPIGLGVSTQELVGFRNQGIGGNVEVLAPESDAGARLSPSNGCVQIPTRVPHPNATKVFTNWLLSKDGQTQWVKHVEESSRRLDAPPGPPDSRPDPKKTYRSVNEEQYQHFTEDAINVAKEVMK